MAGVSRIRNFVKTDFCYRWREEQCDVDLRLICYDVSQQVSSFLRSTAVCSTTVCRDLLLQRLNPHYNSSVVMAPQAATHLEVACLFFVCPA